jgi:hypothetical protein
VATNSAYDPYMRARRPGGKPAEAPRYRILVHKRFETHYDQLISRVGLQQAQQFWDHVATNPGGRCAVASTCYLRGDAGRPQGAGWSRTIHYEVTSSARINYQFHDSYCTTPGADAHRVVAILTISYSSH